MKRIKILATGGTIAGEGCPEASGSVYRAGVIPIGKILETVPGIAGEAELSAEQVCSIDSKDMTEKQLLMLSARVEEILKREDTDGLVITHGTDTMEETAFFLQMTVPSAKPVVLTGAMRPATAPGADGPENLLCAVRTAASDESVGRGVLVVMNDRIEGALDVTKRNTSLVSAFASPNRGPLGEIREGRPFYFERTPAERRRRTFCIRGRKDLPKVEVIYGHSGADGSMVRAAVRSGVKGIVYAGMGNGSVHAEDEKELILATRQGVAVVLSTRVGSGAVTSSRFSETAENIILSGDLNPQKARLLLQLALTETDDPKRISEIFNV